MREIGSRWEQMEKFFEEHKMPYKSDVIITIV